MVARVVDIWFDSIAIDYIHTTPHTIQLPKTKAIAWTQTPILSMA